MTGRSKRGDGAASEAADILNDEPPVVRIHRYRDSIALWTGDGRVVYLSRAQALAVSRALKAGAVDVAKNPDWADAKFGTWRLMGKHHD